MNENNTRLDRKECRIWEQQQSSQLQLLQSGVQMPWPRSFKTALTPEELALSTDQFPRQVSEHIMAIRLNNWNSVWRSAKRANLAHEAPTLWLPGTQQWRWYPCADAPNLGSLLLAILLCGNDWWSPTRQTSTWHGSCHCARQCYTMKHQLEHISCLHEFWGSSRLSFEVDRRTKAH